MLILLFGGQPGVCVPSGHLVGGTLDMKPPSSCRSAAPHWDSTNRGKQLGLHPGSCSCLWPNGRAKAQGPRTRGGAERRNGMRELEPTLLLHQEAHEEGPRFSPCAQGMGTLATI